MEQFTTGFHVATIAADVAASPPDSSIHSKLCLHTTIFRHYSCVFFVQCPRSLLTFFMMMMISFQNNN